MGNSIREHLSGRAERVSPACSGTLALAVGVAGCGHTTTVTVPTITSEITAQQSSRVNTPTAMPSAMPSERPVEVPPSLIGARVAPPDPIVAPQTLPEGYNTMQIANRPVPVQPVHSATEPVRVRNHKWPFEQRGNPASRVGPRWYNTETGLPVNSSDAAFQSWFRQHQNDKRVTTHEDIE